MLHFLEEPGRTIFAGVDLNWFKLIGIVESLHDLISHTDWLMLLVEGGGLGLLVDWLSPAFEVCIYCEGTILLIFIVFEFEFCTFSRK